MARHAVRVTGALVALVVSISISSQALAQIVYEPVRYQWGQGQNTYFYGGSDPMVHYFANQPRNAAGTWGRINGWNFASGNIITHREVSSELQRVFVDAAGFQYTNAAYWGATADDARNDAYFNAPRYFRKRDLLNAAVVMPDGSRVVPSQAQPIQVASGGGLYIGPARRNLDESKPVMIIPKDLLKKQLKQAPKPSDKQMASAK